MSPGTRNCDELGSIVDPAMSRLVFSIEPNLLTWNFWDRKEQDCNSLPVCTLIKLSILVSQVTQDPINGRKDMTLA